MFDVRRPECSRLIGRVEKNTIIHYLKDAQPNTRLYTRWATNNNDNAIDSVMNMLKEIRGMQYILNLDMYRFKLNTLII